LHGNHDLGVSVTDTLPSVCASLTTIQGQWYTAFAHVILHLAFCICDYIISWSIASCQ